MFAAMFVTRHTELCGVPVEDGLWLRGSVSDCFESYFIEQSMHSRIFHLFFSATGYRQHRESCLWTFETSFSPFHSHFSCHITSYETKTGKSAFFSTRSERCRRKLRRTPNVFRTHTKMKLPGDAILRWRRTELLACLKKRIFGHRTTQTQKQA